MCVCERERERERVFSLQKKKAEGPLLPEQPTKKLKSSDSTDHALSGHTPTDDAAAEELKKKAESQGEKVRSLKTSGADMGLCHVMYHVMSCDLRLR